MRELEKVRPWATYLLLACFFGVFMWQMNLLLQVGEDASRQFIMKYSFREQLLLQGEYYRLLTSVFLHAGLFHLLSNSLVFFVAGKPLEKKIGALRFSLLFFASAVSGSLLTALLLNGQGPAIGASGGVMGVLAGASLLVPTDSTLEQVPVIRAFSLPVVRLLFSISILGVFLVLQESLMAFFQVYSMVETNVGHVAHFGGALAGVFLSYIWYPEKVSNSLKHYVVFVGLLASLLFLQPFSREWVAALLLTGLFLIYWSRE